MFVCFFAQKVYVVLEIFGHVNKIQAVSQSPLANALTQQTSKYIILKSLI